MSVLSQKTEGQQVREELLQYPDTHSGSNRDGDIEHHTETSKAVEDLFDLTVLVTAVGGIAAYLIWQERQAAAR